MSNLKRIENVYDVTKRLLGEIEPYGDTATDNVREQNLKDTIDLVEKLTDDIILVARYKGDKLSSRNEMGKIADYFITELRERVGS